MTNQIVINEIKQKNMIIENIRKQYRQTGSASIPINSLRDSVASFGAIPSSGVIRLTIN